MKAPNYFLLFLIMVHFCSAQDSQRNMIILLDQEGKNEHIGSPGAHFLSSKFQSALQEKASPIIINAALLKFFIEKRKSIEQMAQIPDSREAKALKTYTAINDRLTALYRQFRQKGIDHFQSKQLMLENVNKEFYAKEAVLKAQEQNNEPINSEMQQALRSYLTKFNQEEWKIYTNQKSLYLFVPTKYAESQQEIDRQPAAPGRFALPCSYERMNREHLGLKIDTLTKVENVEDPARLYFDSQLDTHNKFTQQLEDFFITKSDADYKPYLWSIALSGHGGTGYNAATDSYAKAIVADLSIPEIQQFLAFLEHKIKTKSFHVSTCYGAGIRFKMIFDDAGNPTYSYPIISDCLSDGYSYCKIKALNVPSLENNRLAAEDIEADDQENWQLKLDFGYEWKKFFKKMSAHSFDGNLNWLPKALMHITEDLLATVSVIRLANTNTVIPVLPHSCSKINDTLIKHAQEEGNNNLVMTKRFAILVESTAVPMPVIIENMPDTGTCIISIRPGESKHYFKQIEWKEKSNLLNAFWPIDGDRFDRHFIIDQVDFPIDSTSPLAKKLGLTDSSASLHNVYVHTQKGAVLRIFFQTKDHKTYMVVINKVDSFAKNVDLKGMHELSPEVAQMHMKRYNELKQELKGSLL